jgi:transposase
MGQADRTTSEGRLEGMPEPYRYWRTVNDGEVLVGFGPRVMFCFDEQDVAMRNLVVVALTQAGVKGKEVAALFGLSSVYVSRLRTRAADGGSRALVPPRGAPRKLSEAACRRAIKLSESGESGAEIARRLGVSEATISRLLARRRGVVVVQGELELGPAGEASAVGQGGGQGEEGEEGEEGEAAPAEQPAALESGERVVAVERAGEQPAGDQRVARVERPVAAEPVEPVTRVGEVEVQSRYAGAMLLYPFLERLGVDGVLCALQAGPARRYDAPALVLAASFAFALGSGSLEQTKHLHPADAGALVGLEAFPSLRTLRPRLGALAESCDPLQVQRAFAKAMLGADERPPELFYVDDHFVTYWGAQPVAKGYNIRRHLAEPGRDDTLVVDDRWRAVCFSSGEPRGLSVTLPETLAQLAEIVGGRPVMLGFDRGGSYPKVFNAIAKAGMEWITWRRAPLAAPTVEPKRSWVEVNGKRRGYLLADEQIELEGYDHGPVRQLSAYEHEKVVFQVLTCNHQLKGAPLVHRLKSRWCIENTYKYLEAHQQIHWLCTYQMDLEANTAKVKNPARQQARAHLKAAEATLAEAERALGAHTTTPATDTNPAETLCMLKADLYQARAETLTARNALKPIPAKLPANQLDPNAERATPRLAQRALQMVCRLLAYNAELDLARRLNTYLADPDEYRTIARNLLHQGGTITYQRRAITVTLDQPHPPRVARALAALIEELNTDPPHLPADRRPITYRLKN